MQSRLSHIRWAIPFLALVLGAAAALPQSLNREAMKWFDAGLAEKNAAKRIAAYTKAVEIDPNFAEALFNLAVACKEQKNYDRAEQCFRRAVAAATAKTDLRVKALSEMASIYNIRGNPKSHESALREAKTLAADPKQRAVLSYELGRLMYQQGRYEQSAVELKDGRAADPAKREAFDQLLKLAENSSQLDYLYANAEKQKAAGSLQEAKATLEQIKAKNANFRDVQTKLSEVETLLAADAGKTASAATSATNVNDGEAEEAYAEGLLAIRQRDWARAVAAFEKTLQLNPEHREARQKLAGALMFLERDNVDAVAARYYDEGVAAMNRNDLDSALVLLGKVQRINRRYRDAASLYAQVEAALQLNSAATPPPPPPALVAASDESAANAALDSLYQIARAAFARGEWNHAVMGFQKIRVQQGNYRDVDQLFAAARSRLLAMSVTAKVEDAIALNRPSPLMIGGFAIAVAGLFAAGFVFFSPVARARYQSRRGNDGMAVLIYESLLARRPNRLKLYPALAEIYLRMDRRDEAAMKIYRRVLELNLPSRHRGDFNEMVTRNMAAEKPALEETIVKTDSFVPEPMATTNGVLLADGGFHMPEKTPALRPRKKKEVEASSDGTTNAPPVAEEGTAEAVVSEAAQVQAPAKPRKPRKKKATPANGGAENGAVITNDAAIGELQLPEPAPVKKPRRKKVTVVDAVGANGTSTYPAGESMEALEAHFRPEGTVLAEHVLPAENEAPRDEPVSV